MVATAGSDGPPPSKCPVCRQDVLSRVRVGSKHVRRLLKEMEIFILEDEEGPDDVPEEGVCRAKKSELRKKFGINTDFIAKKFESAKTAAVGSAKRTAQSLLRRKWWKERLHCFAPAAGGRLGLAQGLYFHDRNRRSGALCGDGGYYEFQFQYCWH
eukprot:g18847.t1